MKKNNEYVMSPFTPLHPAFCLFAHADGILTTLCPLATGIPRISGFGAWCRGIRRSLKTLLDSTTLRFLHAEDMSSSSRPP
jgi:hypothetical protein